MLQATRTHSGGLGDISRPRSTTQLAHAVCEALEARYNGHAGRQDEGNAPTLHVGTQEGHQKCDAIENSGHLHSHLERMPAEPNGYTSGAITC